MSVPSTESLFRQGLVALADDDPARAAAHFKSAIEAERHQSVTRPEMRYLSYYGLSLALAHGPTPEAIHACEVAVRGAFYDPHLLLNLGRVYLMAGKTTKALAALEHGLKRSPCHWGLRSAFAKLDRREAPPLSVVPRDHAMNVFLGRARQNLRRHAARFNQLRRQESEA
jgi:tetratricopeptide (TPR) repeat protein